MRDLIEVLPRLLPKAIAWAHTRATEILKVGQPLSARYIDVARGVGVSHPERIRVQLVSEIPLPEDAELRSIALQQNLLGPGTHGLTLGYGIYLVMGNESVRLISHECRHVYQYERAGSIDSFIPLYLAQIARYGYESAPFEEDARNHELTEC